MTRAQQLGQSARAAQLGDDAEHAAQLAGERLDPRRRPWIGDQLDVGVGAAALGLVQRCDAGATLDADDGGRITGRQRADVGHLGDDGDRAGAGVQQDAGLARARAAATAERNPSEARVRVTTAPGRTTAGSRGHGQADGAGQRSSKWRIRSYLRQGIDLHFES